MYNNEEEYDISCRICLQNDVNEETDRLFSPCDCSGSQKYVHIKCLDNWRKISNNINGLYQCTTCHFPYKFNGLSQWRVYLNNNQLECTMLLICLLSCLVLYYYIDSGINIITIFMVFTDIIKTLYITSLSIYIIYIYFYKDDMIYISYITCINILPFITSVLLVLTFLCINKYIYTIYHSDVYIIIYGIIYTIHLSWAPVYVFTVVNMLTRILMYNTIHQVIDR